MIEILDRSKNRPLPRGLVSTLRSLEVWESIVISEAKKSSIHPAAKRAGVRMSIRTLGDGTVCAWRVPSDTGPGPVASPSPAPKPPAKATAKATTEPVDPRIAEIMAAVAAESKKTAVKSIFDDGLDIFGEPLK
jgi:hypothetical protein